MTSGIRKVAMCLMFSFIFLSLGLVYWQVVRADSMLDNPANRRTVLMESRIIRGGIYDRNGVVLAATENTGQGKKRTYPQGEMFEPLLGYATVKYGAAGLESTLGKTLMGLDNSFFTQRFQELFEPEKKGNDVILTIDAKLQEAAYQGLKGKSGAVVAIDPQTGDVLALVSQPSFDPNLLEKDWESIIQQPLSPMANHAFLKFPPGSIMKVVTSEALFLAGQDTSNLYHCAGTTVINGQTFKEQNDKIHGWVNYDLALAYSCNTYFAEYGVKAGQQNFLKAAAGFGFGKSIPFELSVPESSITNSKSMPENMDINLFAASTFGQGEVMVTPFHAALITAAIANQGKMMEPHIIDRVVDYKQNTIYTSEAKVWLNPLRQEDAQKVKSAMILAVNSGTAAPGGIAGVQVAAKTGSAETGDNGSNTHGWYIAFAPADNPVIAVAVLAEHGGTGGAAAAPIAKAVMEKALEGKVGGR
ncbi:penicillin-binding protein transpeptidase [Syntrophobotulus glycolicus DSM 8271]|uniref:Penicillin-binding protein transpeptidase n=1 Tax=Syntrophobotulus glycolicus (strain DSM 8271 / FlGlyR) TaxID=645991 RepID=F0SUQ7_SYNGF|nr:penicillin-binding transpeptidase domain-containing protein [Syntrophobotulus glycolicus]ADY56623.1 penicillin-binding protein transpeptidase [Syntrophobotulus glycolicus DSM 8271]